MAAKKGSGAAPIIIKRVTVSGEGHHGGAWKVAYADFVTAMMAFFLLMWLLNATDEQQRAGLADYFNPAVVRTPGASGNGNEKGVQVAVEAEVQSDEAASFETVASHVQDQLNGMGAESMQMTNALKHVVTRMTDEGLVIELTDLAGAPLFVKDTAQPQPVLRELTGILARVLDRVRNQTAIAGHVRSYPEMLVESPVWPLSDARAHTVRNLLEQASFDKQRIQRVTGYADHKNRSQNAMDPQNNRIEVILLR